MPEGTAQTKMLDLYPVGSLHPNNPQMEMGADGRWKFRKGNALGTGRVRGKKYSVSSRLRTVMECAVTEQDVMDIMDKMVDMAKRGNISAAREVFDRVIGKADESAVLQKLEELEVEMLQKQTETMRADQGVV